MSQQLRNVQSGTRLRPGIRLGSGQGRLRVQSAWRARGPHRDVGRFMLRASALTSVQQSGGNANVNWLGANVRVPENGQPSQDIRELCALQLGILQTLLRSTSDRPHQLRAAVYMRVPGPGSSTGTVLLQRVAVTPPSGNLLSGRHTQQVDMSPPSGSNSTSTGFGGGLGVDGLSGGAEQSVIMLQLGAHGELHPSDGTAQGDMQQAESCLASEEVLVLPSSGSLVLPLVDGQSLVGLMLVEPARPISTRPVPPGAGQQVQQQQPDLSGTMWSSHQVAVEPEASSLSGSSPSAVAYRQSMVQAEVEAGGASVHATAAVAMPEGSGGYETDSRAGQGGALPSLSISCLPAAHMRKPVVSVTTHQPLADGHFITPGPAGIPSSLVKHYAGFTDEEIHALRAVAPLLAKACAMELRAAMQCAASTTQAVVAARLLREAVRPASALNTFATMLLPRMDEGSADRDLVKNISNQGKRLQEMLQQLEQALAPQLPRPPPVSRPLMPPPSYTAPGTPGATLVSVNGRERVQPAWQSTARDAWAEAGTLQPAAAAQGAAPVRSLPRLPRGQPQQRSGTQRSTEAEQVHPQLHRNTSHAAHPVSHKQATPSASHSAVQQEIGHAATLNTHTDSTQQATEPQAHAHTEPSAQTDASTTAAVQHYDTHSAPSQSHAHEQPASHAPPLQPRTFTMRLAADAAVAADGVIDMEPLDSGSGGSPWSADRASIPRTPGSGRYAAGQEVLEVTPSIAQLGHGQGIGMSSPASVVQRPRKRPVLGSTQDTAGSLTDVAPALLTVLSAAARLASVTGIVFSVHPPLQIASASTGSAHSRTSEKAHPSSSSQNVDGQHPNPRLAEPQLHRSSQGFDGHSHGQARSVPLLMPRPTRPLHVAVAASTLHRIMAYVVDLALQCTPFGGSVAVSARSVAEQGARWVELIVAHTGQMVTQRLHSCSATLHSLQSTQGHHSLPSEPTTAHGPRNQAMAVQPVGLVPSAERASTHQGPLNAQQAEVAITKPPTTSSSTAAVPLASAKMQPGVGLLSFAMAEELVVRVGGHIHCNQPVAVLHTGRNTMEQGTQIIIQLPVTWPARAALGST